VTRTLVIMLLVLVFFLTGWGCATTSSNVVDDQQDDRREVTGEDTTDQELERSEDGARRPIDGEQTHGDDVSVVEERYVPPEEKPNDLRDPEFHWEQATKFFADRDYHWALKHFTYVATYYPEDPHFLEANDYAGHIYFRFALFEDAAHHYEIAAKETPVEDRDKVVQRWLNAVATLEEIGEHARIAKILQDHLMPVVSQLTPDLHVEVLMRLGVALFHNNEMAQAQKVLLPAVKRFRVLRRQRRLRNSYYGAQGSFYLAELLRQRFQLIPLEMPEYVLVKNVRDKNRLLTRCQSLYMKTMMYGHLKWATAAAFQMAKMFEDAYQQFVNAPLPPGIEEKDEPLFRCMVREQLGGMIKQARETYEAVVQYAIKNFPDDIPDNPHLQKAHIQLTNLYQQVRLEREKCDQIKLEAQEEEDRKNGRRSGRRRGSRGNRRER
jgi:hypothetical protein